MTTQKQFYNSYWIVFKEDKKSRFQFDVYKHNICSSTFSDEMPLIYKAQSEDDAKMWIDFKLIKAFRVSANEVKILYKYRGYEFVVTRNNTNPETGKDDDYYDLQLVCLSELETFNDRVIEAIRNGEADNNEDCLLYMYMRDTFDSQNCTDLE